MPPPALQRPEAGSYNCELEFPPPVTRTLPVNSRVAACPAALFGWLFGVRVKVRVPGSYSSLLASTLPTFGPLVSCVEVWKERGVTIDPVATNPSIRIFTVAGVAPRQFALPA